MNQEELKPTTRKAVDGMKYVAYSMSTSPRFYKTLKEADINEGFCDDRLHRRYYNGVLLGYESVSYNGRTLTIDKLANVNNNHIEGLFISMITENLQFIMDRITEKQDRD